MKAFKFTIRLTSDGEPGTGLGGNLVNQLVPRNYWQKPIIPASHVKGLMKDQLGKIVNALNWEPVLLYELFGKGDEIQSGIESPIRLVDAQICHTESGGGGSGEEFKTGYVSRTAISDRGVAEESSLRTSEVVPVGTTFEGELHTEIEEGSTLDLAWRLSLLAIHAIGGNRQRGCGACVVEIEGEDRDPSELLEQLAESIKNRSKNVVAESHSSRPSLSDRAVVLKLIFEATAPVCCPEIADKTNVINTGFSIPASAVQGMILHRLNAMNQSLADALFTSEMFRAWPLNPCWLPSFPNEPVPSELPTAIRVSLTHRASKFAKVHDEYGPNDFLDRALEECHWTETPSGAPLKASDGVLLHFTDGDVRLWKAAHMPHVITAHGVHSDPSRPGGRNLFTFVSMAPMVWSGLVVVPDSVADLVLKCFQSDPYVAIGKRRSVRGSGRVRVSIVEEPVEWRSHSKKTVLIAQSPLLLSSSSSSRDARDELADLFNEWGRPFGFPPIHSDNAWANVGIRFGWTRLNNHGRQAAVRVALPGSVVAYPNTVLDPKHLREALIRGVGKGRERGFGAVCAHPGKAQSLFMPTSRPPTIGGNRKRSDAIRLVLEMHAKSPALPTPSQIRSVQEMLRQGGRDAAVAYLKRQTERTPRIWFTWSAIFEDIQRLLSDYSAQDADRALEVLSDMAGGVERRR